MSWVQIMETASSLVGVRGTCRTSTLPSWEPHALGCPSCLYGSIMKFSGINVHQTDLVQFVVKLNNAINFLRD